MPEGDTIRVIADDFVPLIGQSVRVRSPQGRFSDDAARIDRKKLGAVETHGKHMFMRFGRTGWLQVHLGMYGRVFWYEGREPEPPRGQVRVRAVFDDWTADIRGPMVCRVISDAEKRGVHATLGTDPLHDGASVDELLPWLAKTRLPVGTVLLMQDVFAGVGNVYRCELPFMLRLNPYTPSCDVPEETWRRLWDELTAVMRDSVDNRRGRRRTTPADFPWRHWVYPKVGKPCFVCGNTVLRRTQANRNLFFCAYCQGVPESSYAAAG